MNFRRRAGILWVFFLAGIFARCGAGASAWDTRKLAIERKGGEPLLVQVELARTEEERARGLMFRRSLEDGKGMLFIYEHEDNLSFWMSNTYIPLSIAFISREGRILEIHDMEPLNLNSVRSGAKARYALEVPRGWFSRAGIAPGDRLEIPD
ncbi:MAG: DUF192 domain-containing protein [Treponema sp.]|jgi:uncharacterized membrane protein (UPF0127 family)|nr:DUF192 domain-containing protein [Treponema sp.]